MTGTQLLLMPLTMLAGVVLLAWARRGRRVDDHPLCRRCGFDLIGRPQTSDRCSECGAELSARRAFRIGHRRTRPLGILLGLALIALPIGLTGRFLWPIFTDPNPAPLKPVWWLRMEAAYGSGTVHDDALDELTRRLRADKLRRREVDAIVDAALAAQSDLARPWSARWGDFVEAARSGGGGVSAERWRRYVRQSLGGPLKFEVPPNVRRGDPLSARIVYGPLRVGTRGRMAALLRVGIWADKQTPLTWTYADTAPERDPRGNWSNCAHVPPLVLRDLADGPHTAKAAVTVLDAYAIGLSRATELDFVEFEQKWDLAGRRASVVTLSGDRLVPGRLASWDSR